MIRSLFSGLRAPAATAAPREPASPHASPSLRAGWRKLRSGYDRLANSFLGDLLATLCFTLTVIVIAVFCLAP